MAKINILPAKVYNRIAAGEVVDRPYSVVKELVENAIDAGATEIGIYIEKGGKQLIRVIDNGCGIARDDLHSAFLPHATSKIEKAEDLETIMTLGFRGEAVASIAAVSKMTIVSKVTGEKCYSLSCNGGDIGNVMEDVGADGTDVSVNMLFYNAPVRLKFLKSDKAEETDITTFVSRFILNRPNVSFTYYADGKKVLQSFGGGEEEAIVGVYGASILQNCYQISAEKHGIKIHGYIGNQNFSKPNKSYQTVFLNGRYVVNATISAAISKAYMSYLMKRQYPFYVLYIDVPVEVVDVNVHPNKADVRFADNQIIFGCLYNVIAGVLDGQSKAMEYIVPNRYTAQVVDVQEETVSIHATPETIVETPVPAAPTPKSVTTLPFEEVSNDDEMAVPSKKPYRSTLLDETPTDSPVFKQWDKVIAPETDVDALKHVPDIDLSRIKWEETFKKGFIPHESLEADKRYCEDRPGRLINEEDTIGNRQPISAEEQIRNAMYLKETMFPDLHFTPNYPKTEHGEKANPATQIDIFAENKMYLQRVEAENQKNRINIGFCRYAGKLFNTYLIYEYEDEVYFIDQHAAHERLIFDKFRREMNKRIVVKQPMLVPYILKLNSFEAGFIEERIEDIRLMGFDIEPTGINDFSVTAVPADLQSMKLSVFFNDILADINIFRSIKLEELIRDKLAMAACKAAVKGGMDITEAEIDKLFEMIQGDMGLKCPHGRPIAVKWTRTNLEKMFKRKV